MISDYFSTPHTLGERESRCVAKVLEGFLHSHFLCYDCGHVMLVRETRNNMDQTKYIASVRLLKENLDPGINYTRLRVVIEIIGRNVTPYHS